MRDNAQENARCNCGADNTCNIWSHSVHEQEVCGVCFCADLLGLPCSHRNGRNACGTDKGIYLALCNKAHELSEEYAGSSTNAECYYAKKDYLQECNGYYLFGNGSCTNGNAKENCDNVHQFVLSSLCDTINNAALLEQVAQHQHTYQRSCGGNQKRNNNCNCNGEDYFFGLGDLSELGHSYKTLFLSGEQSHYRRLDKGNQSHIGVCRKGDSSDFYLIAA